MAVEARAALLRKLYDSEGMWPGLERFGAASSDDDHKDDRGAPSRFREVIRQCASDALLCPLSDDDAREMPPALPIPHRQVTHLSIETFI